MKNNFYTLKAGETFEKRLNEFKKNLSSNETIVSINATDGYFVIVTEVKEGVGSHKKLLLD